MYLGKLMSYLMIYSSLPLKICDMICENPSHGGKFTGITWKFESSPFQNILLGSSVILVSKVTDVQRLSKIKKNIRIVFTFFFILQFHPMPHVTGFLRSHHMYRIKLWVVYFHSAWGIKKHVSWKYHVAY